MKEKMQLGDVRRQQLLTAVIIAVVAPLVPGYAFDLNPFTSEVSPPPPPLAPVAIPASLHPDDIVGRRGMARISISEIAKRNRTAMLIRLMTAKGMFSRYRTSRPQ
jgi:hypothetical protein